MECADLELAMSRFIIELGDRLSDHLTRWQLHRITDRLLRSFFISLKYNPRLYLFNEFTNCEYFPTFYLYFC